MEIKKHIGTITFLVQKREIVSREINEILTNNSRLITTRLGVNIKPSCIKNCSGLIALIVEGTVEEINKLTNQLNSITGVKARNNIMTIKSSNICE
ncbi:MAG: hypothetical protein V1841_00445 [Patescibacteria group bacterium]